MSEIVNSIIESSRIISAPLNSDISGQYVATTDEQTPLLSEMLNLTAFYTESAKEVFSPETLQEIQDKVGYITEFAKNSIENPSEQKIIEFISEHISEEDMQSKTPVERLERLYVKFQIETKLNEIEKLRGMLDFGNNSDQRKKQPR